jgi:flagellar hook-associated protein 3 FlgL
MRIADKMQFEQVKANIGKNRTQMSELQNQAATQKRVVKPSDDPLAASRVLSNRIDLQGNKQFGKSLTYAKSFLDYTDQSLGELGDVLMRAKELAVGQANDGSANEHSRRVVATELEQLYNQIGAIGNRKLGDRFIFGGFSTQSSPFDDGGQYKGDRGEMMVHIDKETFLPMNVPGARIFLGEGVTAQGMIKGGPPQAKSIEALEKQTALEPHNRMNTGGAPAQPQVVNRGPSSVGGLVPDLGLSPTAENSEDESNGVNLFHVLKDFSIALKTNDKSGVQDVLEVLDDALNQVLLTRAQVGSRAMAVDNYIQTMEKQKLDNKTVISQLEDADVFSTVSDINKTQSTLQATLETSGKLIQSSLMQFLR